MWLRLTAQRRVDQLDLGAEGHRMVGQQGGQRLVDGVDEPGQEPLYGLRVAAGTDPGDHGHESVGPVAVCDAVVLAGHGPGAQGVEGGQAVVEGRRVHRGHQGVDVGQLCEVG